MVLHTPTKLEILRQTAAQRSAGRQEDDADSQGQVPPSVLAAAQTAAAAAVSDPLPEEKPAGTGVAPPSSIEVGGPPALEVEADIHAAEGGEEEEKEKEQQEHDQEDKLSVSGSLPDEMPSLTPD